MRFFFPLSKVEENPDGTLTVEGIASSEEVDSDGEIIRAEAIRQALPDFFRFGTGALREMHQPMAAGTVDEAQVASDGATYITATVVDPVAATKVRKGVYKGFSIGGRVKARDDNDRKIITDVTLSEISLVDRPANPKATINLWKGEDVSEVEKRDYSDEERAEMAREGLALPDGSFPIADRQDLDNAIRAYGRAKSKAKAKAHIIARAKDLGATDLLPEGWMSSKKIDAPVPGEDEAVAKTDAHDAVASGAPDSEPVEKAQDGLGTAEEGALVAETAETAEADPAAKAEAAVAALEAAVEKAKPAEDVRKGMYDVEQFATLLQSLSCLVMNAEWERMFEGDDSPVPAKLRACLNELATAFQEMAAEELGELLSAGKAAKGDAAGDLGKTDAEAKTETTVCKVDVDLTPEMRDMLAKVEAAAAAASDERDEALAKLAARDEALAKLAERVEPLAKAVEGLTERLNEQGETIATLKAENVELAKRVAQVEDQPETPLYARAVTKQEDTGAPVEKAEDDATLTPEQRAANAIKKSYRQPMRLIG